MYNNKLCLLELIELLMNGINYFYPYHPTFKYERIGVKNIPEEDYPLFMYDNAPVPFEELTWHNTRANLSVLAKIPGRIKVKDGDNEKDDNKKEIKTFIYRNFTIIKDGKLHINLLPCHIDTTVYNLLTTFYPNVIVDAQDYISVLDFTKLDIINDRVCQVGTSALNLSHRVMEKLRLDCHMKVLKSKIPKDTSNYEMKEYGIKKDGSYAPPSKKREKGGLRNYYTAKEFNIRIPNRVELCDQFMVEEMNSIEETKKALQIVTHEIQKYKFYLILCGKWFDDLDEDNKIVFHDVVGSINVNAKVSFSIDNVKVEYD